jgi:hypothetical protein
MTAANWGFEWGDAFWGEEQLDARTRLLKFVRSPRMIAVTNTFADRTENYLDVASDVAAAFDIDNAVGVHLDRIGEIVQLPRYGASDARYRVLLQIQIQLILSSTTTTNVILRVVELFTGFPAISYQESYPMGFAVGAIVSAADSVLLLQLLGQAKAAAYNVELITVEDEDWLEGDYSADPLTLDAGDVGDYSASAIAGADAGAYSLTV